MDKKILLQNLADSLSERTGMTKRKAENFVRSFFEITEEGLLGDGVVKVKGFGTTKVVKVNDRESVNINTGERFQIEGHAKVTFTPDTPFKELVNRPFAQFTTIVLEDDVDLEELNAVDAESTEEATAESTEETVEENTEETVEETTEELVEEGTAPVDTGVDAFMDTVHDEDATEDGSTDEEDSVPNEEQAHDDMQQPIIIQNTMPVPPSHNWWRIAFFTLLTVLLMVSSYFAGYYRIFCPCTSDGIAEQPAAAITDTTCTAAPQVASSAQQATAVASEADAETATEAQPQQRNAQTQAEQAQETTVSKGPTAAEREAAKKYRQMEGGEYLITGVLETHKMAVGDNLFKLAKKAYGNKNLASYIILHNNFTNPDVIQLGQDIEIPKLTHK